MVDYKKQIEYLKDSGFSPMPNKVKIAIPNAKNELWQGIQFYTGSKAKWMPEYDEVVRWLSDNDYRGLLCLGNCGLGKTLICGKILPILINHYCKKLISCYDALQMNANIDAVKSKHIVYVDDIGTESLSVKYGEKRLAFAELVDEAEKRGKLLIITTNLSTDEIREKYGERTLDRLKGITKTVLFTGQSFRK
jgi:DNA replication protein DnaC